MKYLLSLSFFLFTVLSSTAQDWANLARFQEDNTKIMISDNKEELVVFMGNSITELWPQHSSAFWENEKFINRGISGQTTPQMLVRFRQDVVELQPSKVVILAGINDIAENTGPTTLEAIANNIFSMAEIAAAHNIEVLICSVLPAYDFPWRPQIEPAQKVTELNGMLKKYAADNSFIYVDYHSATKDKRDGLRSDLGDDGVHPNSKGYNIMESILGPVLDGLE